MTVVKNDKTIKELKEATKNILKWRFSQVANSLPLEGFIIKLPKKIKLFFIECLKARGNKQSSYLDSYIEPPQEKQSLKMNHNNSLNSQTSRTESSIITTDQVFYLKLMVF